MNVKYESTLLKEKTASLNDLAQLRKQLGKLKRGLAGENNVFHALGHLASNEYTVLHNLKPEIDGTSCEIDALVIGKNGIFVIEIKTPKNIKKEINYNDFVFNGVERQLFEHFLIVHNIFLKENINIHDENIHQILCISKDKNGNHSIEYDVESFPKSFSVCNVDEISQYIDSVSRSVLSNEQINTISKLFKAYCIKENALQTKINSVQSEINNLDEYLKELSYLIQRGLHVSETSKKYFESLDSYRKSDEICEICDKLTEEYYEHKKNLDLVPDFSVKKRKKLNIPKCISRAIIIFGVIAALVVLAILAQPQLKLLQAKELIKSGNSDAGLKILEQIKDTVPAAWTEIENYIADKCDEKYSYIFTMVEKEMEAGNYSYALSRLKLISNYEKAPEAIQKCCYELHSDAIELHNEGKVSESIAILETISDCYEVYDELAEYSLENFSQLGDAIYFGHTGLKWYVTGTNDEYYTLILSECIPQNFANYKEAEKYFNSEFIKNFNDDEKTRLAAFDSGNLIACPTYDDLPRSIDIRNTSDYYWVVSENEDYELIEPDGFPSTVPSEYKFTTIKVLGRPIIRLKK